MMLTIRAAFTLLEVVAAVVVLSIITVVVMPVVQVTLQHYAAGVSERAAAERAAFAIDRCVRVLREVPVDDSGLAGLATMESDTVILSDGSGLELDGDTLLLRAAGGEGHPLCTGVSAFSLVYLAADGTTATTDPALIERVNVTLAADGVEMGAAAYLRGRIGG